MRKGILPSTYFRDLALTPVRREKTGRFGNARGFNVIELALVMMIILITLTEALPSLQGFLRSYRAAGDAKSISSQLALARMRSAANFTQARLYFDLASKSYHLETYNKTTGQFRTEGGAQNLAGIDSFGYGTLSTPAGTQTVLGQSAACTDSSGHSIANTSCILFNSRSVPVDSAGATTSNDAVYLTDGSGGYFSVTVSPSGRISVWRYIGSAWVAR
jgi:Tfp pilus assembly protein FimT